MAKSLNKCMFIGNLAADPEIRSMQNGKLVGNFRIAVSESWQDKATGQKQEFTEWVSCVAYDKLAEIAEKYCKKGGKLFVEGRMKTRKWKDQGGADKYTTEIIVENFQLIDGKPATSGQYEQQSAPAQQQRAQHPPKQSEPPAFDQFDNEVPF